MQEKPRQCFAENVFSLILNISMPKLSPHLGALHRCSRNDQGSTGGLSEGTEEVGAHPGDVSHVVAHVVRNGGGVVGIVLRVFGAVLGRALWWVVWAVPTFLRRAFGAFGAFWRASVV